MTILYSQVKMIKEGRHYVVYSKPLNVSGYGPNKKEALLSFVLNLNLLFEDLKEDESRFL